MKKPTVLFVDDDVSKAALYYSKELVDGGFKVVRCYGPDEAIDWLEDYGDQFSAAIVDISMPPGSKLPLERVAGGLETGPELVTRMRAARKSMPIILLSAIPELVESVSPQFAPDTRCVVVSKLEKEPFELLAILGGLIKQEVP